MSRVRRFLPVVVIAALVIAAGITIFTSGDGQKAVTAYFPRAISVYEGSDVRVLGVSVGQIDTVEPDGTRVKVTMSYDETVDVPADARAVIISPSIVGDRYVQLTPVYESGAVIENGAVIDESQTAVPLEIDEIFASIDDLTVALGPDGANKRGALTDLLEQTAKNFGGQGAQFNQTIRDFSTLSATLDNNKEELFGSAAELQNFLNTLAENDTTVRQFNDSLGQVSTLLSGERQELSSALSNLSTALGEVGSFVDENREVLGRNIKGLDRVAKVLVKQRAALDETLQVAPLALNNLAATYNPDAGTLDTNANVPEILNQLTDSPGAVLCSLLAANDPNGQLCDLIQGLPLPRSGPFGAGTGSAYGDQFDPTLGGLVGVDQ